MVLSLADRWFNPTDETIEEFAGYSLSIDGEGKSNGRRVLTPGKIQRLTIKWKVGSPAQLIVDGKRTSVTLPVIEKCEDGISYIHYYNPAKSTDLAGFSIVKTKVN